MMSWRDQFTVLAFGIRSRRQPAGRAKASSALAGLSPRLSSPAGRATSQLSANRPFGTMSKRHGEIDHNPFIPSSSPVCRVADTVLVYCVALFGLAAAVLALCRQVVG